MRMPVVMVMVMPMSVFVSVFLSVSMPMSVLMRMRVPMLMRVGMSVFMPMPLPAPHLLRVPPLDRPTVFEHAKPGAGDPAPLRLAGLDGDSGQPEPGHGIGEDIERHAKIQTGAEKHVSGDAAAAVQVVVRQDRASWSG